MKPYILEQAYTKELDKLMTGISYPGVKVQGVTYTGNVSYIDSAITSSYTDTALGTRSQDIIVDGGSYYDTYSSHAPEELVPGIMFDNLYMLVSTGLKNNTQTVTYSISHIMQTNANVASGNVNYQVWPQYHRINPIYTSVLTANLNITDSNIHVANASAFFTPSVLTNTPGVVYINGEKITYWTVDTTNNVLGQIRRAVDGTGAANTYVTGTTVIEQSSRTILPGGNVVHLTTWLNTGLTSEQYFVPADAPTTGYIVDNTGKVIEAQGSVVGSVVDGTGLEGSTTDQAKFIKGQL